MRDMGYGMRSLQRNPLMTAVAELSREMCARFIVPSS